MKPNFPTTLHQEVADLIRDYFSAVGSVDTVLVVNSCARGQAVPESDLDFAILASPHVTPTEIEQIEAAWQTFAETQTTVLAYKQSNRFAQLHLDVIDGNYRPTILELGAGSDYFEVEIGNQIRYSAPLSNTGPYFRALQDKWLPYYDEALRSQRLDMSRTVCEYDLDHIPFYIKRGLYFQAMDTLCQAFQSYLQTLFIANRTYPIAYNKWIKEQIVTWLNQPALYPQLPPILSVRNIESDEIIDKVAMLRALLDDISVEAGGV